MLENDPVHHVQEQPKNNMMQQYFIVKQAGNTKHVIQLTKVCNITNRSLSSDSIKHQTTSTKGGL